MQSALQKSPVSDVNNSTRHLVLLQTAGVHLLIIVNVVYEKSPVCSSGILIEAFKFAAKTTCGTANYFLFRICEFSLYIPYYYKGSTKKAYRFY